MVVSQELPVVDTSDLQSSRCFPLAHRIAIFGITSKLPLHAICHQSSNSRIWEWLNTVACRKPACQENVRCHVSFVSVKNLCIIVFLVVLEMWNPYCSFIFIMKLLALLSLSPFLPVQRPVIHPLSSPSNMFCVTSLDPDTLPSVATLLMDVMFYSNGYVQTGLFSILNLLILISLRIFLIAVR